MPESRNPDVALPHPGFQNLRTGLLALGAIALEYQAGIGTTKSKAVG